MVQTYARILGFVFLVIGVLGFIPGSAPNGMLLGIFMVDGMHNMVHFVSGIILLAAGFSPDYEQTRRVVLAFAVVYGLITILGFFTPDGGTVLGMRMNMADDILHLAITATALMFALPQSYPMAR